MVDSLYKNKPLNPELIALGSNTYISDRPKTYVAIFQGESINMLYDDSHLIDIFIGTFYGSYQDAIQQALETAGEKYPYNYLKAEDIKLIPVFS
jgi:hypothetical protein